MVKLRIGIFFWRKVINYYETV